MMRDVAMLMHEPAGLMRRRFEQEARPSGLTLLQWRALNLLEANGPLRQVAIGEALEASPMAISDLAQRLRTAGYVSRQPDPRDNRAKTLSLTPEGARKVAEMRDAATSVFSEIFEGLTDQDADALRSALTRIKTNLGGPADRPRTHSLR